MSSALNRRAFLAAGAVATAGLAVANQGRAGAATGLTVYRLDADWGYPIGPKGKTRCACRSCFRRAYNGFFKTESAAITGRVHKCCVCQPYAVTLQGVSADDLFLGGVGADRRDERVAAVLDGVNVPTASPLPVGLGQIPAVASSATALPSAFARTGTSMRLAVFGAGAAALGAVLTIRNRGASQPAPVRAAAHLPIDQFDNPKESP